MARQAHTNGYLGKANSEDRKGYDEDLVIQNPNLKDLDHDVLHHLCLDTQNHDLPKIFGDVKFVCMGGPVKRMKDFANYLLDKLDDVLPMNTVVQDFKDHSYRYSMYKVGPVLCINHGMGAPSIQILLSELIKLMHYAKVNKPVFFRIGSSGGIGVEPGTVVVSQSAIDEFFNPYHSQAACGKLIKRPAILNEDLARELKNLQKENDNFQVVIAKTMSSTDFFEGQARLDGPFCYHTEEEKMQYLRELYDAGVRNIEMEAKCFAAMTHLAGIRAAVVCAAYNDRFKGDQIRVPQNLRSQWEMRPLKIVARYIKTHLS